MLARRIAAGVAGVVIGGVALAGSAFAHVEVEGKPAQALAKNAQVSFSAEAENGSAGIKSVRVVLPTGIAPADVTYVSGPAGWTFAATADGYTVSGKALAVHKDAAYAIKIRQLPAAASVAFKTLVTYDNNAVDRWIELPTAGDPSPDHPAPLLKLAAAAPGASPEPAVLISPSAAASPSTESATVPSPSTTADKAAAEANSPAGTSVATWVIIGAFAVVAVALGTVLGRRRAAARQR
ncbi:DUF1775 domain-containing protein [Hamadaea tsunoensis]|uniref:DUF1775 domain-containing protein n=1 Tax=Hamadaea tsunoensis TaxID=53368 RepID=UPI000482A640|nr:DUF1775 domain-containing protein [Hamadaea tsunoensis]